MIDDKLRALAAINAMNALIICPSLRVRSMEEIAKLAVKQADALLKELGK